MKNKKKLIKIAVAAFFIIVFILISKIANYQFNKYDNMSIEEVIEERGGSKYPYIQSENYYIIFYGRNKEEVFYIDEENRNILINAYIKTIDKNMFFDFVDDYYRIFETVIYNEEDYIFSIKYTGERENVIIYDVEGEWDNVEIEGYTNFFKTVKHMDDNYRAYIDFGDGNVEEINGEYIINEFE